MFVIYSPLYGGHRAGYRNLSGIRVFKRVKLIIICLQPTAPRFLLRPVGAARALLRMVR